MSWLEFEKKAVNFLKNKILGKDILVSHDGKSDSNADDIKIYKKSKLVSIVEVKEKNAQMGQIVIVFSEDRSKFILSPDVKKNRKIILKNSSKIIDYVNDHFDKYKNPTQKGIKLKCSNTISHEYINSFNKMKKCNYFISHNEKKEIMVVDVVNFKKNFKLTPIIRRKKSGSRNLSLSHFKDVEKYIKKKFKIEIKNEEKKYLVEIPEKYSKQLKKKDSRYFNIKNYKYYLSLKNNNFYYIKICSSTNNPNIIFEVKFSPENNKDDLNKLIEQIKNF